MPAKQFSDRGCDSHFLNIVVQSNAQEFDVQVTIPSPQSRLRVLLVAEAANPEWSSVPLIGWKLSKALAKLADVHLVTHIRNREAISRARPSGHQEIMYVDNEQIARPLYRLSERLRGGAGKGWTTISAFSSLSYYSFELVLWRQVNERIRRREFDVVHRITPVSPTCQSPIAKWLVRYDTPFVLGPLNGGLPWLNQFRHRRHDEKEWLSYLRPFFKIMPGYTATRRHSDVIITGSRYVYNDLPRWARAKSVYIPENGVDFVAEDRPHRVASTPLRAAFIGRLVPYKGADIVLEAAAGLLRAGKLELHLIGDGPQRPVLEATVDKLRVRPNVYFHGWLAQGDAQEKLQACDILTFPSIREFGGAVVIEAMALGVVPIVADYGGPAELVDDHTGVRVKFDDEASLVEGLRKAIEAVVERPQCLRALRDGGLRTVRERFTWDAKAAQILSIYNSLLHR
jgi:glycosyltransferase involved in cell wall biosynthesis